jgi:HlyD family secretion protein
MLKNKDDQKNACGKEDNIAEEFRKKRARGLKIKIVVALIVIGLISLWVFRAKASDKINYDTQKLSKGTIQAIVSSTGSLAAVTSVDVGSRASGNIQELLVDFNDRVKAGQILARIDTSLYDTQLEKLDAQLKGAQASLISAQADLDKSRIAVEESEAGVFQAQAGVDGARANLENVKAQYFTAKANLQKAKAQLDNDKKEYTRYKSLLEKQFVSQSDTDRVYTSYQISIGSYESAKAGMKSAEASIRSASSNLQSYIASLRAAKTRRETAKSGVTSAAARLSSAHSSVKQWESEIANTKVNRSYCIITSPVDGIVIDRKVEKGQTLQASYTAPTLFVLAKNLQQMQVKASVDEADIGKVKEGQDVTFTVDAFPDDEFKGKITQVRSSAKVEQNVVTYEVIITTDNSNLKLKPGMTANINIVVETKDNVLKVPNAALRFRPDKVPGFPMPDKDKEKGKGKGKDSDSKVAGDKGKSGASTTASSTGKSPGAGSSRSGERGKGSGKEGKGSKKDDSRNASMLWVLEDGKPKQYRVIMGISDNTFTEMKSGDLKEGMEVITDATIGKEKKDKPGGSGVRVRF